MIRTRSALLDHLSRGGRVRYELRHEPEPKTIWTVPDSGEAVHAGAAKWALAGGRLRPLADGLFPDTSQTFEAAQ